MHPYRMDPCPQGTHLRGIYTFMGVPVHKAPVQRGSVGPWEYGDGTDPPLGLLRGGDPSRHFVLWRHGRDGLTVIVMAVSALGMISFLSLC